jgi:hypothetical protein
MVSPLGFHESAIQKAKHYNIGVYIFGDKPTEEIVASYPESKHSLSGISSSESTWLLKDLITERVWVFSGDLFQLKYQNE